MVVVVTEATPWQVIPLLAPPPSLVLLLMMMKRTF